MRTSWILAVVVAAAGCGRSPLPIEETTCGAPYLVSCDGVCTNPSYDPSNCGSCG